MNTRQDIYSVCAAVLPAALGLGLIYLCVMGTMELSAALLSIAGLAALVRLAIHLARTAEEEKWREYDDLSRRIRRHRPVLHHHAAGDDGRRHHAH